MSIPLIDRHSLFRMYSHSLNKGRAGLKEEKEKGGKRIKREGKGEITGQNTTHRPS